MHVLAICLKSLTDVATLCDQCVLKHHI